MPKHQYEAWQETQIDPAQVGLVKQEVAEVSGVNVLCQFAVALCKEYFERFVKAALNEDVSKDDLFFQRNEIEVFWYACVTLFSSVRLHTTHMPAVPQHHSTQPGSDQWREIYKHSSLRPSGKDISGVARFCWRFWTADACLSADICGAEFRETALGTKFVSRSSASFIQCLIKPKQQSGV